MCVIYISTCHKIAYRLFVDSSSVYMSSYSWYSRKQSVPSFSPVWHKWIQHISQYQTVSLLMCFDAQNLHLLTPFLLSVMDPSSLLAHRRCGATITAV